MRRSCGRQDGNDSFDIQSLLWDTINPGGESLHLGTDLQILELHLRKRPSFKVLITQVS